jgi:hypothetical protein
VRDADRTTKVKSSGGHTQGTPIKGMRFETFAAAQTYLDQQLGGCQHQGLAKLCQVGISNPCRAAAAAAWIAQRGSSIVRISSAPRR